MQLRIGVMAGGGHCPGINDVVANLILFGQDFNLLGFKNGWLGISQDYALDLSRSQIPTIVSSSLSLLGTSRLNPFLPENSHYLEKIIKVLRKIDVLIAIGGEDTLGVASNLSNLGIPIIGIPKTLDNDLPETDFCIGFMSVVENSIRAINSCKDTAFAHQRVAVVETLGRHTGWVALYSGTESFADWIVLPEFALDSSAMHDYLLRNCKRGGLVVCSENAQLAGLNEIVSKDGFNHELLREKGVAKVLAAMIQENTGIETRWTQLTDSVRGGFPNAFDRILARRFAKYALKLAESQKFGSMVAIKNDAIIDVNLSCARGVKKITLEHLQNMWRQER